MAARTAVIGFGVAGRVFHAPLLAADGHYSIDAVVTGDPDRAALVRQRYPGAAVVPTAEELWRRADALDLVVVATPPAGHVELARTALAHGLHTVVDKPVATSSAGARSLIEAAERAGRVLSVFQNRRWDGDFRTVQRLVRQGALGTVHAFESRFEWWKPGGAGRWKATTPIADGGGILFDLGPHLIDQAITLFGPVTDVWGDPVRRATDDACDADDDTFVVLTHAGGTRSRLLMSSRSALPGPRFHVLGSEAAFTCWGLDPQEKALAAGAVPGQPGFGAYPGPGVRGAGDERTAVELDPGDYGAFYRGLADAIEHGAPPPVDPADAVTVLELIERVHRHH